jgi:hypothetical protein
MTLLLILFACNPLGGGENNERQKDNGYDPIIQPENFLDSITNTYWPMRAGNTWKYENKSDEVTETIDIEVLKEKKQILGISCTVVHDRVYENGRLIEDTYDWYAQDKAGNVWYMGEDSREMDGDKIIGYEGSWEAGVDGAKPGIIMWADPFPGMPYRQEYYFDEAEDWGQVVEILPSLNIGGTTYQNVVKTKEWTPLEKDYIENKYYAPGVGLIKEQVITGGTDLLELKEFKKSDNR